jgi:hypothetical protein
MGEFHSLKMHMVKNLITLCDLKSLVVCLAANQN